MLRTHKCNELTSENTGKEIILCGWVSNRRDHGGIIFIDLRDRYGITQIVFDPEDDKSSWAEANSFRSEYVIRVTGNVRLRPEGQNNQNLSTGEIEIIVSNVELLSKSKMPPFELDEHADISNEEIRFKHRYIDLRRKKVLDNVIFRSNFLNYTRSWFIEKDFLDVQTPIFTVSSPEGARDYLIPSRLNPGKFYALPQAPQQYKQLLMVGGIDKYFQIAPCFRDEDPRADRHSCEFYQIDCEMSFVEQADVFNVVESFLIDIIKKLSDKKIMDNKFYQMSHNEAKENYGSDKPDLRFGMKFVDLTDIFVNSNFGVFKSVVSSGGVIKAIKLEGQTISRKDIDDLTEIAKKAGAAGLAYIIYDLDGPRSPILKFFSDGELSELEKRMNPKTGDIIFFSANEFDKAVSILNVVRLALKDKYNLADDSLLSFCWVTDFPMFSESEINGKIDFEHNPFSMPKGGIEAFNNEDLLSIKGVQYDLACNGYEMLSGSIRNHDIESLVKAFEMVGRTREEVKEKFGAMYEAFQYGVPPHGGFAFGVDRFMMLLKNETNIREIYAFPKSGRAQDTMMNAPSVIDNEELDELHIDVKDEE